MNNIRPTQVLERCSLTPLESLCYYVLVRLRLNVSRLAASFWGVAFLLEDSYDTFCKTLAHILRFLGREDERPRPSWLSSLMLSAVFDKLVEDNILPLALSKVTDRLVFQSLPTVCCIFHTLLLGFIRTNARPICYIRPLSKHKGTLCYPLEVTPISHFTVQYATQAGFPFSCCRCIRVVLLNIFVNFTPRCCSFSISHKCKECLYFGHIKCCFAYNFPTFIYSVVKELHCYIIII